MWPNKAIEDPVTARQNQQKYFESVAKEEPAVYKVGDDVRVLLEKKSTFQKGYVARYLVPIYKIERVIPPSSSFRSHHYVLKERKTDCIRTMTFY